MRPNRLRFALILGFCFASACAAAPEARPPTPEASAQYHVLAGELAAQRGQPGVAAREFLNALGYVPDSELAARATELALGARDDALALQAARRWLDLEDSSLEAREVIARLSLRAGDVEAAFEQAVAIIKGHAGGEEDGLRHVALLLAQEGERGDDALTVLKRLRDQWSGTSGAHYALGLLALRFDALDVAEAAAREALRIQPASRESLLLLTGILVKRGALDAADQALDAALEGSDKASAAELRLGYVKLLLDADKHEHAQKQLRTILKLDPDNADAHFALALLSLEQEKPDEAEPHLKAVVAQGARKSDAAYYLGRIEQLRNKPAEALKWYRQVTSGNQVIDAAVRQAMILGNSGQMAEARGLLEQLRRQYPPLTVRFYLAEGEMLIEAGQADQALAVYQKGLEQDPGNADLFYARSLVYERLQKLDLAEADLRRLIEANKDDARALNALGYMLTVHTQRLDEARGLVTRALAIEPDDAAIIDSLGWIEFRLGNYPQARQLLQKAFQRIKDPEVAAHLGEVLWVMGDKEEARAVWAAALSDDPDHHVLRETVERLTE